LGTILHTVGCPVKAKEAKATFVDGLITVEIPYRDEFAEAVEIALN